MSQQTTPLHEAARMLGLGSQKLYRALRSRQVLDNHNLPYRRYVQQGLLTTELKSYEHPTLGIKTYATPHATEKGIQWLAREFDVEISQACSQKKQAEISRTHTTRSLPMELIIITGPQGCGKSQNAKALKAHYNADQLIEEYSPGQPLPIRGRVLALTNIPAEKLTCINARVVEFKTAMQELG